MLWGDCVSVKRRLVVRIDSGRVRTYGDTIMGRIVRSIWMTVVAFAIGQSALMLILASLYSIPPARTLAFHLTSVAIHVALGVLLTVLRDLFVVDEQSGASRALSRVNAANVLTMTRVSATPLILWLLVFTQQYRVGLVLVVVTAVVFLTDLFDGQVSRRLNQVTRIGRYLDSISDYTILIAVSVGLVVIGTVPWWFFVVTMVRLGAQWVMQAVLFVAQHFRARWRSSLLGKASIFAVMAVYAVSLLSLLPQIEAGAGSIFQTVLFVLCSVATVIIAVSLGEKIVEFVSDFRDRPAE